MIYKKLVKENLDFSRKKDVLSSLGIGSRKLIKDWLDEMGIEHYMINDDLTIDALDVHLANSELVMLPDYIQFNSANIFNCDTNRLISLRGCPKRVRSNFNCFDNHLTSLDGCPEFVGGYFDCEDNYEMFSESDVTDRCVVNGDIYI